MKFVSKYFEIFVDLIKFDEFATNISFKIDFVVNAFDDDNDNLSIVKINDNVFFRDVEFDLI